MVMNLKIFYLITKNCFKILYLLIRVCHLCEYNMSCKSDIFIMEENIFEN